MTTIYVKCFEGQYLVRFRGDDPTMFRLCVDSLKSCIRADRRGYDPQAKYWYIDESAELSFRKWLDYARAWLHARIEWESESDYEQPPPPPKSWQQQSAYLRPYTTLHLLPSAPPELIKAAYKCLAMKCHPDHGGSNKAMQELNAAYETLAEGRAA
jgi:hypothetical protein